MQDMPKETIIPQKIKWLYKNRMPPGWTGEDVRKSIGVSRSQLTQYLRDENPSVPGTSICYHICRVFNVPFAWLVDENAAIDQPSSSSIDYVAFGDVLRYMRELHSHGVNRVRAILKEAETVNWKSFFSDTNPSMSERSLDIFVRTRIAVHHWVDRFELPFDQAYNPSGESYKTEVRKELAESVNAIMLQTLQPEGALERYEKIHQGCFIRLSQLSTSVFEIQGFENLLKSLQSIEDSLVETVLDFETNDPNGFLRKKS